MRYYPLRKELFFTEARTKTLIKITIQNSTPSSDYIPKINAGPGIYMGECLVTNKNGKASVFAINSTSGDVNVIIPPLTLESYDSTIKSVRPIKVMTSLEAETAIQDRINRILESLDLIGLDHVGRVSVEKLVSQFRC